MQTTDQGAADGTVGVDVIWKRKLRSLLADTPLTASLEESVAPLAALGIDQDDLAAVIEEKRDEWAPMLVGSFGLDASYRLDFAVAIYIYTLADPPVYRVVNQQMFNPARRLPPSERPPNTNGISAELQACMPYIKFLDASLEALPDAYRFTGEVHRGVRWVYPSPNRHDPRGHFATGAKVMWYEFKSTSEEMEVMTRPHFCGVGAGPRTIFTIDACCAYSIKRFSYFQGMDSEFEVVFRPLSEFQVVDARKRIIDPKEESSLEMSGFPDTVVLKQLSPKASAEPDFLRRLQQAELRDAAAAAEIADISLETSGPPSLRSGGDAALTGVLRLFHGTTANALHSIQAAGHLQPSIDGFFGPGVYLTSSREKAAAWANFKAKGSPTFLQSNGWGRSLPAMPQPTPRELDRSSATTKAPVVVEVQVDVGRCKVFDMISVKDEDYFYYMPHLRSCYGAGLDTLLVPKGLKYGGLEKLDGSKIKLSGISCNCWRCLNTPVDKLLKSIGSDISTWDRTHFPSSDSLASLAGFRFGWNGVGLRNNALCATTCRGVPGHQKFDWGNYETNVKDEFGRLVSFDGHGFWRQQHNGTRSWLDEGFDSQFVPETLPRGAKTLDIWPGCVERFAGDEYVVADGCRVIYRSFSLG
jgi:hypothetical protein